VIPDNAGYYHAAYAAAAAVYVLYAISIWWRARKVGRLLGQSSARGRDLGPGTVDAAPSSRLPNP
jgi:hypothetical protein